MKRHSLLAVAMSALLAAGCSSDDIVNNEGNGNNNGATGNAYISLSVQLPTTTSTRATDTFDDGAANEYAVKDMTVLVFNANDDFETCYTTENGSMELPSDWTKDDNNTNNITAKATTQALKVTDGEKHVVVVLNNNKKYDFSHITKLSDLKTITSNDCTGDKFIGGFSSPTTGFYMTTSPYYNGNASTPKIIDYATVTPTTQINSPGRATVYVERLAAKVSLSEDLTTKVFTVAGGTAANSTAVFQNWALDVTNKTSYLFRHVNADWVSSDANRSKFTDNTNPNNRIRFAEDTNFNSDQQNSASSENPKPVKSGLFTTIGANHGDDQVLNSVTANSIAYCFENTFDENNMRQDRTTRVIFKAKYTPAGFTTSNNSTGNWYTIGSSATPLTETQFIARVNAALTSTGLKASNSSIQDFNPTMAGRLTCTDTKLTTDVLGWTHASAATDLQKLNDALGSIQVYKGGICYYIGRIRHFNDTEAAWTMAGDNYAPASLGRYGIVRNNWYKITVNKVSQPGSPFVPQTTPELDDVNNYYIDCDVNIEPWAVRSQGFDF